MSGRSIARILAVAAGGLFSAACGQPNPATAPRSSNQQAVYAKVQVPFAAARAVNSLGVGKACEKHADCQGQPAATCPRALNPKLPNWCSMLCDVDADCGANAFCWTRPSVEGGLVGSCAPLAARLPD